MALYAEINLSFAINVRDEAEAEALRKEAAQAVMRNQPWIKAVASSVVVKQKSYEGL